MIYTIGRVDLYEPAIDAGSAVKQGPGVAADGKPYPGGWVWETADSAQAYIETRGATATRRVYGVLADWARDTVEVPGEPTRCLTRDARVVRVTARARSR